MKKLSAPTTPLNPPVFYTSAALTLSLVGFAVLAPQLAQAAFDHVQRWIVANLSWFYVLAVAVILVFTRISRGRTAREFVCGALLVPTAFILLWMTAFGGSALHIILDEGGRQLAATVSQDSSLALFAFLDNFPWSTFLSLLAVVMAMVLFVASAVADKRELAHQSLPGSRGAGRDNAWQQHLVHFPKREAVTCYIDNVITPACNAVAIGMVARNVDAMVQRADEDRVRLSARHGEEQAFSYEVRLRSVALPVFATDSAHEEQSSKYYRAEVFLQEGGQGYCVMSWSRDDVIADILDQYERHLQFQNVER